MAKSRRLFRYGTPAAASRTLDALQRAFPDNAFTLTPERMGFGFNILATKPDGTRGLVAKAPLSSFGKES